MTVRVLIADDSSLQRSGWRMVLESQPDLEIVGEAGDGARVLAIVRREPTDVVLMDVHMPRVNGLVASERILTDAAVRELGAPPRIVLATALELDDHLAEAARAGVFAVIHKDTDPESLFDIVRAAASAVDGRAD
ncbi:MAG: response regulator transcription factor [Microcella sp.]|uniref:response regulator n=1 Tax=Microcella sp. TaxID=1913979 RepID=UPI0024CCBB90|nr:response regulator transcription factor [Microcella sp.]UYN84104.1 MAG: response regulator transcription factor [Microcella sp.]